MRISTNWVKDYVDINDYDLNLLADNLTNSGVNVEAVEKQVNATNLTIGHVLSRKDHPSSDHLNVCQVDLGDEVVQIVCGAPNVDKGQKVIVSKVGAILPGGIEIKKSVIRGEESNGMICALSELGLEDEIEGGIHVLDSDAPVGQDPLSYLGLNDTLYTLDLNPNRKADCTNHIGFAYEVGAVTGRKVNKPDTSYEEIDKNITDFVSLKVDTDLCTMYTAKMVSEVEIKESPKFIKDRLTAAGMRPINNVVDISNYIMLEYGQPLHFFDADSLGSNIVVRTANENEKVITLDNKTKTLNNKDVVITDGKEVVAIAGVMGALNTEVTNDTKNIVIESAIFNPLSVRSTSLKLDLRSEAALRYERGLNYEYTLEAMARACHLLQKYANAKIYSGMLIHDKIEKTVKKASVTLEKINSVMGCVITQEEVEEKFNRLGFPYECKDNTFNVTIPGRRQDVNMREDLIEEVGRLHGFDKIVSSKPFGYIKIGGYEPRCKYRKDASSFMRSLGTTEVRTYSLVNEKEANTFSYEEKELVKINRPINSERTVLRSTLIPSLLEVFDYNNARNYKDMKIYEISNVYTKEQDEYKEEMKLAYLLNGNYIDTKWQNNKIKVDFYLLKGMTESILKHLGFDKRYKFVTENIPVFMHPGMSASILIDNEFVGFIGKINPKYKKQDIYIGELNLEKLFNKKTSKLKFKEANIYPSVKRDVAFLVNKDVKVGDMILEINKNGSKILTNIEVFDVFDKGKEKSIGFTLTFEDYNKTLTEEEINNVFNKIIDKICNKFNAELRNK